MYLKLLFRIFGNGMDTISLGGSVIHALPKLIFAGLSRSSGMFGMGRLRGRTRKEALWCPFLLTPLPFFTKSFFFLNAPLSSVLSLD